MKEGRKDCRRGLEQGLEQILEAIFEIWKPVCNIPERIARDVDLTKDLETRA